VTVVLKYMIADNNEGDLKEENDRHSTTAVGGLHA
jgi:hypothetical protein